MEETVTKVLRDMEGYAARNRIPIVGPAGRELLIDIVRKLRPAKILEVGTAIGYSTLLMARELDNCKIVSIELDVKRIIRAEEYLTEAGVIDRVTLLNGDAARLLPEVVGPFDMVYLDAAKGQYLDCLMKIINKLSSGAVIAADNVLFRGWVQSEATCPRRYRTIVKRLREYIKYVMNEDLFYTDIYENGDGMAISSYRGEFLDG